MVQWMHEGVPARADDLQEVERQLSRRLPDEYRLWLTKRDGAVPVPGGFLVPNHPEQEFEVQVFFGLQRAVRTSRLSWNIENYTELTSMGWLPLACTDTNDLLILGLSGEKYGQIWFYDSAARDGELWFVSDGFEAFLESLYDPGDG
jgi:cell wall assembly regulator SMI1